MYAERQAPEALPLRGAAARQRVRDELRRRIVRREILPGDKLPNERQLAADHGVSRETIRWALKDLVAERLVWTAPGVGSFIED